MSDPLALLQRARNQPGSVAPHEVLHLQRALGNQAVNRHLVQRNVTTLADLEQQQNRPTGPGQQVGGSAQVPAAEPDAGATPQEWLRFAEYRRRGRRARMGGTHKVGGGQAPLPQQEPGPDASPQEWLRYAEYLRQNPPERPQGSGANQAAGIPQMGPKIVTLADIKPQGGNQGGLQGGPQGGGMMNMQAGGTATMLLPPQTEQPSTQAPDVIEEEQPSQQEQEVDQPEVEGDPFTLGLTLATQHHEQIAGAVATAAMQTMDVFGHLGGLNVAALASFVESHAPPLEDFIEAQNADEALQAANQYAAGLISQVVQQLANGGGTDAMTSSFLYFILEGWPGAPQEVQAQAMIGAGIIPLAPSEAMETFQDDQEEEQGDASDLALEALLEELLGGGLDEQQGLGEGGSASSSMQSVSSTSVSSTSTSSSSGGQAWQPARPSQMAQGPAPRPWQHASPSAAAKRPLAFGAITHDKIKPLEKLKGLRKGKKRLNKIEGGAETMVHGVEPQEEIHPQDVPQHASQAAQQINQGLSAGNFLLAIDGFTSLLDLFMPYVKVLKGLVKLFKKIKKAIKLGKQVDKLKKLLGATADLQLAAQLEYIIGKVRRNFFETIYQSANALFKTTLHIITIASGGVASIGTEAASLILTSIQAAVEGYHAVKAVVKERKKTKGVHRAEAAETFIKAAAAGDVEAAKVLLTMKAGKELAKRLQLNYPKTIREMIAFVRHLAGNQDLLDELRFDLRESFRSSGKNQYKKGKAAKLGEKLLKKK